MDLNLEIEKKNVKSRSRILIIILSVIILLSFIVTFQVLFSILRNEKIYKGIYVDDINASDLLPGQLYDRLITQYKNEYNNIKIKINVGEYHTDYYLKDFDFSYDIDYVVDKAFSIGRQGNIFNRLSEILNTNFNERIIYTEPSFSAEKVDQIVNSIYNQIYVPVEDPGFEIQNDIAFIKAGHHGKSIDKEHLRNEIIRFIKSRKNANIDVPINITYKSVMNLDSIYDEISLEPVNATSRVENGKLVIIPHKNGIKVDREALKTVTDKINNSENIIEEVKLTLVTPEITQEYFKSNLFKDTIAYFSTYYSTEGQANIDRAENLRIASEKINGKILAPGDVFSFNETVGERTEANGFKHGQIFEGGRIVEGIGGGICQVSSTLYNAALRANLKILERVNHMFTVPYVPEGLDATVAYGVIDFRFQNSTRWPIRIEAFMTENNQLVMRLIGTKEKTDLSIEFYNQIIKTVPFNTVYIDDPNLPEGTTKVVQVGKNGAVVDTYKIVKENGIEVSRTKISTSSYTPLDQRVLRGTGKVQNYQENHQEQETNQQNQELDQNQSQQQDQHQVQEQDQQQTQQQIQQADKQKTKTDQQETETESKSEIIDDTTTKTNVMDANNNNNNIDENNDDGNAINDNNTLDMENSEFQQ
ncbi:MAG: hypothetical protein GYA02_00915 [Clostridiaceae bacterium]|nr:hypothetical protein [Clostridiaceae bacterium]